MGSPEMPKENKQDQTQAQQAVSKRQLHFLRITELSLALRCLVSRPEHSQHSPDQPSQPFCLRSSFHKDQKNIQQIFLEILAIFQQYCMPAVKASIPTGRRITVTSI